MKRLIINPFKEHVLHSPEEPINYPEEKFWEFYLNVLKLKGVEITNADIEFYIKTIMFEGLDKDLGKEFNYKPQYVHMMRKRLIEAGLLIKNERGKYSLHKGIANMKTLIKEKKIDVIQFTFPFNIP